MKIAFSTTKHFLSKVIRWLTKAKASHVSLHFDLYGVPVVMQADIGGVQIVTLQRWLAKGNILVESYEIVPDITGEIKDAMETLGEAYDYVGLFGYLPVMFARWFGKKIKNPLASPKALICVALLMELNRGGLIKEFVGLDPDSTTPEDVLEICRHSSDFKRVQ